METPTMQRVTPETLERLRAEVDAAEELDFRSKGFTHQRDGAHLTERAKFWALDIGSSGAWMVRKADGAIFGIKAYGTPHYGRAIGYIGEVTGAQVHALRWTFANVRGAFRRDITK